ncbi:MAG: hypothetical protein AB1481_00230 [Candidatus Omnitrophota bacterium]
MKTTLILTIILSLFPVLLLSQEDITITTYYPSPFGSYRELRAQRMAIGDTYFDGAQYCWPGSPCTNTIKDEVDLFVEGSADIGRSIYPAGGDKGNWGGVPNSYRSWIGKCSSAGCTMGAPMSQDYLHISGWTNAAFGTTGGNTKRVIGLFDDVLIPRGNVGIGKIDPEAALDMGEGGIRLGGAADGRIKTNWPDAFTDSSGLVASFNNTTPQFLSGLDFTFSAKTGDKIVINWNAWAQLSSGSTGGALQCRYVITRPDGVEYRTAYIPNASANATGEFATLSCSDVYAAPLDGNYRIRFEYRVTPNGTIYENLWAVVTALRI